MIIFEQLKVVALTLLLFLPLIANAEQDHIPRFDDYPVGTAYTGEPAKVVLATDDEKMYRTRLKRAIKQPMNFAGEYVVTTWGCGSSCTHGAVVSLKTGRVVFLPGTICCWEGEGEVLTYRQDSRILVAAGVINDDSEYGVHYYEFTKDGFRHIKTVPIARTDY
jgi:hypothetical protein